MTHPSPAPSPEEILDRLAQRMSRSKVDAWEIYLAQTRSLGVGAKAGQVDLVRRKDETGVSLRIIDRHRLGFAYSYVFTPEALDRLAQAALTSAELTDPQPELELPPPPDAPYPSLDTYDPAIFEVPLSEKIARVLAMEQTALTLDRRVEKVRRAEYHESEGEKRLVNSHGLNHRHQGAVVSGSITVKAADGADAEIGGESDFSLRYQGLDLDAIAREAASRAVSRLGGRKIGATRKPVLVENRAVAELLSVLEGSFLSENVQKGKSMFAGQTGRAIMPASLTLVDDGLYPGGLGSSPADAEGVPHQRTVLVDQGVMQGYLYDLPRARKDGVASTGNAGRSIKSPPGVGTTNLILLPGRIPLDRLLAELGTGLFVTDFMGLHTANPISGDFSLGVSGFWVEGGRIVHPVKGMAAAGNIKDVFQRIGAVGSDLRLFGGIGAPSLIIEEMTVSGN